MVVAGVLVCAVVVDLVLGAAVVVVVVVLAALVDGLYWVVERCVLYVVVWSVPAEAVVVLSIL